MRGSRCKALRRVYRERTGESPTATTITSTDKSGLSTYQVSVWRRVKKAYMKARRGW